MNGCLIEYLCVAFYSHYIYNFVILYFLHEMQIMNNEFFFSHFVLSLYKKYPKT